MNLYGMIAAMGNDKLSLVDASIADLAGALDTGVLTCVELVAAYLRRISSFDCRGPALNSIPILNPAVFDEAAASDERRANGVSLGLLDGVPFTVKDSYKVKGLTVASGSPAFQDLVATEDAFTVQKLKEAGAVLIGKTNMCPMAAGGMARGVYGRAESPYNMEYLAAAYASGSSNGSGVSTGASFAAFGMGEETVSSGRSPASNNALVAYTPSRGALSIRGSWPLYPTCDVVVPHARSMDDLLAILDVIVTEDQVTKGDFWRDQNFIKLPRPWQDKPTSLGEIRRNGSLQGLRIAVPTMYIGGEQKPGVGPIYTSKEVVALYQQAKSELTALGATVIEVEDFPVVENYELANAASEKLAEQYRLPNGWHNTERSVMIAHSWEQFLRDNGDFNFLSLSEVDYEQIYPAYPPDDPQVRYSEPINRIHYDKLQSFVSDARKKGDSDSRSNLMAVPGLKNALDALELMRKDFFEDWLSTNSFDLVAFPACGDVGKADADIDYESAEHAWRNGVKYSNGNRALRHVGIPSVTIPMGNLDGKDIPVGLTLLGPSGSDINLLQWAYTYEGASRRRTSPNLTPALGAGRDIFEVTGSLEHASRKQRPELQIEKCSTVPTSRNGLRIIIEGFVTCSNATQEEIELDIIIDAQPIPKAKISIQQCHGTVCGRTVYDFHCNVIVPEPPRQDARNKVPSRKKIARDSTMVVVVAGEGKNGWKSGFLRLL